MKYRSLKENHTYWHRYTEQMESIKLNRHEYVHIKLSIQYSKTLIYQNNYEKFNLKKVNNSNQITQINSTIIIN